MCVFRAAATLEERAYRLQQQQAAYEAERAVEQEVCARVRAVVKVPSDTRLIFLMRSLQRAIETSLRLEAAAMKDAALQEAAVAEAARRLAEYRRARRSGAGSAAAVAAPLVADVTCVRAEGGGG